VAAAAIGALMKYWTALDLTKPPPLYSFAWISMAVTLAVQFMVTLRLTGAPFVCPELCGYGTFGVHTITAPPPAPAIWGLATGAGAATPMVATKGPNEGGVASSIGSPRNGQGVVPAGSPPLTGSSPA
jgi:hypothetical protein